MPKFWQHRLPCLIVTYNIFNQILAESFQLFLLTTKTQGKNQVNIVILDLVSLKTKKLFLVGNHVQWPKCSSCYKNNLQIQKLQCTVHTDKVPEKSEDRLPFLHFLWRVTSPDTEHPNHKLLIRGEQRSGGPVPPPYFSRFYGRRTS